MDIINLTPYAGTGMIDTLKGAADIIEEVSENEIYFGFCKPGTEDTDEPAWSIMKISVTGVDPAAVTTSFKWANGTCAYNLVWDDRADYTYKFKKF